MSSPIKRFLLVGLGLIVLAVAAQWWWERSTRTAEGFIATLSKGRYQEAQALLVAPSSIEATEGGGLVLTDRAGNATTAPKQNLPFLSLQLPGDERSRGRGSLPSRINKFTMIALGESKGGILLTQPIRLHLQVDGGKVHIDKID